VEILSQNLHFRQDFNMSLYDVKKLKKL